MNKKILSVLAAALFLSGCPEIRYYSDEEIALKAARVGSIIPIEVDGTSADKEFGRVATKPIPTGSIPSSYVYLKLLHDEDGLPYQVERYGSMRNPNDERLLMDKYRLTRIRSGQSFDLYLDPYNIAPDNSVKAPFGIGYIKNIQIADQYHKALEVLLKDRNQALAREMFEEMADETYYAPVQLSLLAQHDGNEKEAYKWRKKAADMGHIESYCVLAMHLKNGLGVPQDEKAAFKRIKECADKYQMPLIDLQAAMAFLSGTGTAKNLKSAETYARRSAEAGVRPGMYIYAEILMKEERFPEACAWLRLAGDDKNGADSADKLCNELLSPEDLKKSDALFQEQKDKIVIDKRFAADE